MNILLQVLLGDLAADGKPVPNGVARGDKATPNGVPFEALVKADESRSSALVLPNQATAAPSIRTHPILSTDDLRLREVHETENAVPPAKPDTIAMDPPEPGTPDVNFDNGEPDVQTPLPDGERALLAESGMALHPVSFEDQVVPPDRRTGQPDSGKLPEQVRHRSSPPVISRPLPYAAIPETPRGHLPVADRPQRPVSPDAPPVPDIPHAPPDHARAIGLTRRPEAANTAIDTPARADNPAPAIVPVTRDLPGASEHRPALPDAAPDDIGINAINRPLVTATTDMIDGPDAPVVQAVSPRSMDPKRDGTPPSGDKNPTNAAAPAAPSSMAAMAASRTLVPPASAATIRVDTHHRVPVVEPSEPGPAPASVGGPDRVAVPAHLPETAAPRAETAVARPVIGQVVQAIARNLPDGVVELRLQPEELGRLRLVMTPGEAGITVQITAERPETLDLVRRHIDLLVSDMKDRGFGQLDFSFGQDGRADDAGFGGPDKSTTPDDPPEGDGILAQIAPRQIAIAGGRVDMRI